MRVQDILFYLFWCAVGFLLGGAMFSAFLPRWLAKKDAAAAAADQNPGAANVFLSCGVPLGLLCLLLDLLKGFFPVYVAGKNGSIRPLAFAAVIAAPVLGHAVGLFNRLRGGKCISTAFGVLLGLLPFTGVVVLLAALYILFSTVLKINPNRRRSIVTFLLFGAGAFGWLMRAGQPALALGCVLVSAIVVLKHSRLFVKAAQTAVEPTPKNNAEKMAPMYVLK